MLKRVIRNYWLAEETNIFRNYRDALAGFVALVIIPAVSIFFCTIYRWLYVLELYISVYIYFVGWCV